jgi:hypothetical protein
MVIYTNNQAGNAQLKAISDVFAAKFVQNELSYLSGKYGTIQDNAVQGTERTLSSAPTRSVLASGTSAVAIAGALNRFKYLPTLVKSALESPTFTSKVAQLGLKAGGYGVSSALGLLLAFKLDDIITDYVTWLSSREPLTFVPLKRNGRPWILGLQGLKPTPLLDSFQLRFNRQANEISTFTSSIVDQILGNKISGPLTQ